MRRRARGKAYWLFVFLPMIGCACFAASKERPNIIFILADDLGWRDLGCYGSTFYETPNLDSLASRGMRFTDAYAACCVCSPTRASILTGKYPARLQLTDWLPGRRDRPNQKLRRPPFLDHLPLEEVTIAEALKDAGYATGFFGKWHLGGPEFYPDKQGFDTNVGGCKLGSPPSYFSPYKIPTLPDGPPGEYLTDRLTQEAVNFIQHSKDKPFLLYLSHYAVHNPQQAKTNLIAKYETKAAKLKAHSRREFEAEGDKKTRQIQDQPVYAAMVQSLDESVGRIVKELNDLGLAEKTIIFFTSDNGGLSIAEGAPTSNMPLRAGKGWGYEGGVRGPLIVYWPGVTKSKSVSSQIVMSTDFYPTILAMAGLPLRPEQHMDGTTIAPLFGGVRPGRYGFWHYPHYSNQGGRPYGAVRFGDNKLIEWYEDMRVELFDLAKDPGERHDLSRKLPSKVTVGRNILDQLRESTHAAMPSPNPDYKR